MVLGARQRRRRKRKRLQHTRWPWPTKRDLGNADRGKWIFAMHKAHPGNENCTLVPERMGWRARTMLIHDGCPIAFRAVPKPQGFGTCQFPAQAVAGSG